MPRWQDTADLKTLHNLLDEAATKDLRTETIQVGAESTVREYSPVRSVPSSLPKMRPCSRPRFAADDRCAAHSVHCAAD